MAITLNGTTGITTPDLTSIDDITANSSSVLTSASTVAASQITGALNATGSAPIYACRAWVNFNGTGTVAIRASGNVSSIADNGTGDYTVNFTTAMPDANYCVQPMGNIYNLNYPRGFAPYAQTGLSTSSVRLYAGYQSSFGGFVAEDKDSAHIAIFR